MFIRRIHLIGFLVVVFLAGVVSGTVYDSMANHSVEQKKRVRISDLAQQVDLSADQKQKLDVILEESRKRMVDINRSLRADVKKIWQETRQQIRAIMTPDQLGTFDKLLEDYDREKKERELQMHKNKP